METKEQVMHTPTPWQVFITHGTVDHIGTRGRKVAAFPWDGEHELDIANAEFIARAVNCHEDLLTLARDVRDWYENSGNADPHQKSKGSVELWHAAKAAIAKAEGHE